MTTKILNIFWSNENYNSTNKTSELIQDWTKNGKKNFQLCRLCINFQSIFFSITNQFRNRIKFSLIFLLKFQPKNTPIPNNRHKFKCHFWMKKKKKIAFFFIISVIQKINVPGSVSLKTILLDEITIIKIITRTLKYVVRVGTSSRSVAVYCPFMWESSGERGRYMCNCYTRDPNNHLLYLMPALQPRRYALVFCVFFVAEELRSHFVRENPVALLSDRRCHFTPKISNFKENRKFRLFNCARRRISLKFSILPYLYVITLQHDF